MEHLDALRLALTLLVIVHHALITYGAAGSWFYVEPSASAVWSTVASVMTTGNQLFFMGMFFLVAGYLTPAAYDRKGVRRFVWERCVRLGVPLVLAVLFACPYLETIKGRSLGRPTEGYLGELAWRARDGELSPGPLWFVETLLAFSVVYAVGRAATARPRGELRPSPRPDVGHRELVLLAMAIASASFAIRVFVPIGQEIAHLQLGFFGQYAILFGAGISAARGDLFARLRPELVRAWLPASLVAFVALLVFASMSGGLSAEGARLLTGGLHWQAAIAAALESVYCVGAIVTLLILFRDRVGAGTLTRTFAPDAYAVYVIHAPVLVAIAFAMRAWPAASPLKCLLAASGAIVACFAASHLILRRIAIVRRVL